MRQLKNDQILESGIPMSEEIAQMIKENLYVVDRKVFHLEQKIPINQIN